MADVNAPPPRDYGQETRDTLEAQVDLAPDLYRAQAEFGPKYTDLQVANMRRALFGAGGTPGVVDTLKEAAPALQDIENSTAASRRTADIASIEELGSRAVDAIESADPNAKALSDLLNQQARQELAAGGSLTPDMAAELAQRIRAAQASRGMGFGLPDSVVEGYALGDRGEALRRARQEFAQRVATYNAATAVDPFLAILGRPGQALGASQMLTGQGQSYAPGQLFNPESGYAADVFNTNFNAANANAIANANNKNALIGAGISAVGNIAGSF